MDTNRMDAPKVVTLAELEAKREEFDEPEGAIAALKAGSATPMVFLRATGEAYQLADPGDDTPPGTPREI